MLYLSVLLCFLLGLFGVQCEPYATADPTVVVNLQALLGSDYTLPENIYDWDVGLIVKIIEEKSPGLLCGVDRSFYGLFPEEVLKRLPVWVLYCQEFYCYINQTALLELYNTTYEKLGVYNCSTYDLGDASCLDPLITTSRPSSFAGGCGVGCKYAGLLHGYSPSKLREMRTAKWISGIISLFFIGIWQVNQWIESKEDKKKEHFCDKGMLHQSTTMTTFFYTATILQLLLPDVVGLDRVLCASNGSNQRVIVLGDPKFDWAPCTVFGVFFYMCVMGLSFYLSAFGVSLWQAFYKPLTQAWETNCSINLRWLDCLFLSEDSNANGQKSPTTSIGDRTTNTSRSTIGANQMSGTLFHYKNKLRQSSFGQRGCGPCCISCMFSPSLRWHFVIWIIMLGFIIGSLVNNVYDAFHVLGICYPGARGNKALLYQFSILPMFMSICVMAIFMPCAGMLLFQTAKTSSSHGQRKRMTQLGGRLAIFFIGVMFCWLCIFIFAGHIAVNTERIESATESRILCELGNGKDCWDKGFRVSPGLIYLFLVSTTVGCFCSMILSFHSRTIDRWLTWFPCLRSLECCSLMKRWTEEVNASRIDKSDKTDKPEKSINSEKSGDKSGLSEKSIEKSKSGYNTNTKTNTLQQTNSSSPQVDVNLLVGTSHKNQTQSIELTANYSNPTTQGEE